MNPTCPKHLNKKPTNPPGASTGSRLGFSHGIFTVGDEISIPSYLYFVICKAIFIGVNKTKYNLYIGSEILQPQKLHVFFSRAETWRSCDSLLYTSMW